MAPEREAVHQHASAPVEEEAWTANAFDDLARWLDAVRSRRTIARLLGAGRSLAPLAAWGLGEAEAKNKPRKRRVCVCSAAGCQSKKVKNRAKVIQQNAPCAYAGGCTT